MVDMSLCYSAAAGWGDHTTFADWRTWHSTDWRKVCFTLCICALQPATMWHLIHCKVIV